MGADPLEKIDSHEFDVTAVEREREYIQVLN